MMYICIVNNNKQILKNFSHANVNQHIRQPSSLFYRFNDPRCDHCGYHYQQPQSSESKLINSLQKLLIMKYPQQQFEVLTESLKKLAIHVDIKQVNLHTLHYIIYQQYSEGQKHNWLYCLPGGQLIKAHKAASLEGAEKFFTGNYSFELYPAGCNDNHIETAMKQALKQLFATN